jgi:hypothetical protein
MKPETCFGAFCCAEEEEHAAPRTSACTTPEATKPNGREDISNKPGATTCHATELGFPTKVDPPRLRSVYISNFSAILQEHGVSVLLVLLFLLAVA